MVSPRNNALKRVQLYRFINVNSGQKALLENHYRNTKPFSRMNAARFWLIEGDLDSLDNNGIGVLSFKTKMHTISDPVLSSIREAVEIAEKQLKGMVIWHPDEPFSAGADLKSFMPIAMKSILPGNNGLEELLQRFQNTCVRMRKSNIPVVAGVQGLALGGGCELMMAMRPCGGCT